MRCVFSDGRRQIGLEGKGWPAPTHSLRRLGHLPAVRTGLQGFAADLFHTILPSDCRLCGGPMLGLSTVRICAECKAAVSSQRIPCEALCCRCGDALGMESARFAAALGVRECTTCRVSPPDFVRAVAYGPYDGALREMLHQLKFGSVPRIAEHVLGPWMAETLIQLRPETKQPLLLPVPLFRGRQRERGYNQAELLANAAARLLRREWSLEVRTDALLRTRDTRAMYELRPDQRRRNLQGAFQVVKPELVQGRDVILIDDILTTGATASHCTRVLLKAGARRVFVATIARAQPEATLGKAQGVALWSEATAPQRRAGGLMPNPRGVRRFTLKTD